MAPARSNDVEPPACLVVADDQEDLLSLMKDALEMEGYEVHPAEDGNKALELIRADPPDLVVLDLWMPGKSGFEVCQELKSDPLLSTLPIIILSATTDREKRVAGMELGADDFVTKPVDLVELLARIRMVIRRNRQGLDANPLTRLPGNVSIQGRISSAIAGGRPLAVLYFDLNEFKAYNDAYGYGAGDKVLQTTASIIVGAAKKTGGSGDFVGHIGGDDFIAVTVPERMEAFAEQVIRDFDAAVPSFYNEDDRKRGKIVSKDRRGNEVEFPLLSIAVGVCHNALRPLESYAQVSQIGAEVKKAAKARPGSAYVVDRRKD